MINKIYFEIGAKLQEIILKQIKEIEDRKYQFLNEQIFGLGYQLFFKCALCKKFKLLADAVILEEPTEYDPEMQTITSYAALICRDCDTSVSDEYK